jgi:AcrR family transcriptional regulator
MQNPVTGELTAMARPFRSRTQDVAARRREILAVAHQVLTERGYKTTSMLEIARRTKASKETLYNWFGNKRGLFAALIRNNAEAINAALHDSLAREDEDLGKALGVFAVELLRLLLGQRAVSINRAAISEAATGDETLGRLVAANGRDATVPRLAAYLEGQKAKGRLAFGDADEAVEALIGLVLGDLQVRRLLGVLAMPGDAEIQARAARAVEQFLKLYSAG